MAHPRLPWRRIRARAPIALGAIGRPKQFVHQILERKESRVPTVSLFFGIVISMYAGDHPEPHFHARYAEFQASYDLSGNRIEGDMPRRQERLIQAWAEIHTDDLRANWELSENGHNPIRIDPLR